MNRSGNVFVLVGRKLTLYKVLFLCLFFIIVLLGYWKIKYSINNIFAREYTTDIMADDYDPENDPQVNPELHDLTPKYYPPGEYYRITDIEKGHYLDPRRPCFGYLFDKGGKNKFPNEPPPISNTWEVSRISTIDDDRSWNGANATSFSINGPVYLPPSGYHIDQSGHQASILYMNSNSITVAYTADGSIVRGYVISIKGINTNNELFNLYKEYGTGDKLVAIGALQNLGTANSSTKFYIRDTGAILDLRWEDDWWTCGGNIDTREVEPNEIGRGERILYGTCNEKIGDSYDGELRPYPCYNCETIVPDPTESCAETPVIERRDKWECGDITTDCGNPLVRYNWEASIDIDTSKTTVPFAGYRDILEENGRSTNLNDYLAEYIEGTAFYDGKEFDAKSSEDQINMIWNLGVFRKLASEDIQNNYRKKMIIRGYDYEVTDGKTTKSMQEFIDHLRPEQEDFDTYEKYIEAINKWLNEDGGIWADLWPRVPMFTREDAPGFAVFTVEHDPGTLEAGGNSEKMDDYSVKYPLAIPHLGRLYESSKALSELLLPEEEVETGNYALEKSKIQNYGVGENNTFIAQAKNNTDIIYSANVGIGDNAVGSCSNITDPGFNPICEGEEVVKAQKPADSVCCDASVKINVQDFVHEISESDYQDCQYPPCEKWGVFVACTNPDETDCYEEVDEGFPGATCVKRKVPGGDVVMERKLDADLELPYLEEIWKYTGGDRGVFNFFKPDDLEKFPVKDAASEIVYKTSSDVNIHPSYGEFYFPYLGGVEQAKKCISEQILTPEDLRNKSVNWCDWDDTRGFNEGLEIENSCSAPVLEEIDINPALADIIRSVSESENVDEEILYAILRNETGMTYFKNPSSQNYCAPNYCGAMGPMQILNGWEKANCDPDRGKTCGNWCDSSTKQVKDGDKDKFDTWENYGCSEGNRNICDLEDSMKCAAKILKGKAGNVNSISKGSSEMFQAVRLYNGGGSCTDQEDCCFDSGEKHSGLCNMTYCGYAMRFIGIKKSE